jgi:group I intron endonuclease
MIRKKSNDTIYDTSTGIRKTDRHNGIYKITNNDNGKVYVGQSVNIFKRINTHRTKLRRGVHGNNHLQLAWNMYEEDSFSFEVLEFCEENLLNTNEFKWIIFYDSANKEKGYNHMIPDPKEEKFRHSEETMVKFKNKRRFSNEDLISFLQEFFYMEGRIFTFADQRNAKFANYPCLDTYIKWFGSFENAIQEAGLSQFDSKAKRRRKNHYTKENIIMQYEKFIEEHKRFPNSYERNNTTIYDLPSVDTILTFFGSTEKLREVLGMPYSMEKEKEKENALLGLKELGKENKTVTHKLITESSLTKSSEYYKKHFGSIYDAMELVGIKVEESKKKKLVYNKL